MITPQMWVFSISYISDWQSAYTAKYMDSSHQTTAAYTEVGGSHAPVQAVAPK
jgi:hypothetical protein